MDSQQYNLILSAIAVCSNPTRHSASTFKESHNMLDLFMRHNEANRMSAAQTFLNMLSMHSHTVNGLDITLETKLYSLQCLKNFIEECHAGFDQQTRQKFRERLLEIIVDTFQSAQPNPAHASVLSSKFGICVSDLVLRDFPQFWNSLLDDLITLLTSGNHTSAIALRCMCHVVEDCTDSDFNSKISTSRRNDVLQGIQEISPSFLKKIHEFIDFQYKTFLAHNETTNKAEKSSSAMLIKEALNMMSIFCHSQGIPLELSFASDSDFVFVYLHLLRETYDDIRMSAATCLKMLCGRKLEAAMFYRLLELMPNFLKESQSASSSLSMVDQLSFHAILCETMSSLVTVNISNITNCKEIFNGASGSCKELALLRGFLSLLSEFLLHPSPAVAMSQSTMWITLLRDPQITQTNILQPYVANITAAMLSSNLKLDFEHDIYDANHPQHEILEQTWDDEDEYKKWIHDHRGALAALCRLLSSSAPAASSDFLKTAVYSKLNEFRDQATDSAVAQLESLQVICDNMLSTLPNGSPSNQQEYSITMANMKTIAEMMFSFNPAHPPLLVRKLFLIESLKEYWCVEPASLPQGIEFILSCLNFTSVNASIPSVDTLSQVDIQVRKKAGMTLVSVGKKTGKYLVQFVAQLTQMCQTVLSEHSNTLQPPQKVHIFEFLTSVASAMTDYSQRNNYIAEVLKESMSNWCSSSMSMIFESSDSLLSNIGVIQSAGNTTFVTDPSEIAKVNDTYGSMFMPLTTIMSVAKRCEESSKARSGENLSDQPVNLSTLAMIDPFVPLWPQILPSLIQVIRTTFSVWHPNLRSILLSDVCMRYALAISDEEVMQAQTGANDMKNEGGLVLKGVSRKSDNNLIAKWPGWFNELRNAPFQMLGLCATMRALYSPDLFDSYKSMVEILVDDFTMKSMEHRFFTSALKQFVEPLLINCPTSLYNSHLAGIMSKLFTHLNWRLTSTWKSDANGRVGSTAPSSTTATQAAADCKNGNGTDAWFETYYAYGGIFVGDLDNESSDQVVSRVRVDLTHAFVNFVQACFALSGSWALTLANVARESERNRKNVLAAQNGSKVSDGLNADKTKKHYDPQVAKHIESIHINRIDSLQRFMLVENETIAKALIDTTIDCLTFPDAHTCRRAAKICHRIIEHTAHLEKYTSILGERMFVNCVKNVVFEPKWMCGSEWDVIALIRDIYCRLVLGQALLPLGQGPGQECQFDQSTNRFQPHRNTHLPREGGGVLSSPSNLPRNVLMKIESIGVTDIQDLENRLRKKRSAKDQKDAFRDLLNKGAKAMKKSGKNLGEGVFSRAKGEEGVLEKTKKASIDQISGAPPLITVGKNKKKKNRKNAADAGLRGGDLNGIF